MTTGGDNGQEKCINSGAYCLEIITDGTATKLSFESLTVDVLEVVIKGKEGQQTFTFTAFLEKVIEGKESKTTTPTDGETEQVKIQKEGGSLTSRSQHRPPATVQDWWQPVF